MANQNNSAKAAIKTYLDNRASTDPQFAVAYANPHKSIDECFNYILSEAKKRGSSVCMTDDEVFSLAVHYYDEDSIKAPKAPSGYKATTSKAAPDVQLTDEEKAQAREAAKKAYELQCMKEYAEKVTQRKKKEAEKLAEQKRQLQEEYPSLF